MISSSCGGGITLNNTGHSLTHGGSANLNGDLVDLVEDVYGMDIDPGGEEGT